MKMISFAWTSPALLAGAKTVTRRDWTDNYARRFKRGDSVAAYDRQPLYRGKQIAVINIDRVGFESMVMTPDSDYEAEGFAWMEANGHARPGLTSRHDFELWRRSGAWMYVVRFELVGVVAAVAEATP